MDAALFDQLEQTVKTAGPAAAIDQLEQTVKTAGDRKSTRLNSSHQ